MRVVLVGGGKVGSFLAKELLPAGHGVTVIEPDPDRAQMLADEEEAVVIQGDGTNVSVLEAGDAHRADWLFAVTGRDEVNLVACQLALALGTKHVLARLNNPLNRSTFEALGIPVVGVTDLMVQVITQEMAVSELDRVAVLGKGALSLCELDVPVGFNPVKVSDLDLPVPSLIAAVVRGDEVFVPEAETVLLPGDRIAAVTTVALESALQEVFVIGGRET